MVTYCAKHFTCIISHKRAVKSYFLLHPRALRLRRGTSQTPPWPWGPSAQEVLANPFTSLCLYFHIYEMEITIVFPSEGCCEE